MSLRGILNMILRGARKLRLSAASSHGIKSLSAMSVCKLLCVSQVCLWTCVWKIVCSCLIPLCKIRLQNGSWNMSISLDLSASRRFNVLTWTIGSSCLQIKKLMSAKSNRWALSDAVTWKSKSSCLRFCATSSAQNVHSYIIPVREDCVHTNKFICAKSTETHLSTSPRCANACSQSYCESSSGRGPHMAKWILLFRILQCENS